MKKDKFAVFMFVILTIALIVLITAIVFACQNEVAVSTQFNTWGENIKTWFKTAVDWVVEQNLKY